MKKLSEYLAFMVESCALFISGCSLVSLSDWFGINRDFDCSVIRGVKMIKRAAFHSLSLSLVLFLFFGGVFCLVNKIFPLASKTLKNMILIEPELENQSHFP